MPLGSSRQGAEAIVEGVRVPIIVPPEDVALGLRVLRDQPFARQDVAHRQTKVSTVTESRSAATCRRRVGIGVRPKPLPVLIPSAGLSGKRLSGTRVLPCLQRDTVSSGWGDGPRGSAMSVRYFPDVPSMRRWFEEHSDKLNEQWIGYYKKHTGIASVTWEESVDVALCYGWIDGLRKRVDELRFMVRFTPRRKGSRWSLRNVERMKILIQDGLMRQEGLDAFANYKVAPSPASGKRDLPEEYARSFREHAEAWDFFLSMRPSYQRQAIAWVTGAKQESTRQRRLNTLIESSNVGEPIPPLRWTVRRKPQNR